MATVIPDATNQFVYEPLEPGQFRILQLAPGSKGDTLVGELLLANFDEQFIEYDALSYMWGDPAPADTILLSSKALPIASNLTNALNHLRYADKPLVIWIDAICINQNDNTERAEQVQLMRQLYSRADTVRIWINEPDIDSTSDAVKALQDFYKVSDDEDDGQRGLGVDPEFWDPVGPLFTNDYWSRAWIQQEVLNASQLSLHCMDAIIPGISLAYFQHAANTRYHVVQSSGTELSAVWHEHLLPIVHHLSPAAADLYEHRNGARFWELHELMRDDFEVSVPHDKVYAIMHLAGDYEDGGIIADYSKAMVDVGIDAIAYHILIHRNLEFLQQAVLEDNIGADDYPKNSERHPTWVPGRWRGESGGAFGLRGYSLPDAMLTVCLPNPISATARCLKIRGIRVDHVRSCLSRGFDTSRLTARQFWSSLLGLYLRVFAGLGMERLSLRTSKVLVGLTGGWFYRYRRWLTHSFETQELNVSGERQHNPQERNDEQLNLDLHQDIKHILSVIFNMAEDPRSANQCIYHGGRLNPALLDRVKPTSQFALYEVLSHLTSNTIVMTETRGLGRIPECAVEAGDEIWVALGCEVPIILRPQPNGRYWHICCSVIPAIQEHKDLEGFSSDIQIGDKIGEWAVEDIDLE